MILLLVVSALIVLLLVAALFSSKEYVVDQEIIINKPKQEVFDYIKIMDNQNEFNEWWRRDPNAKKEITGIDGTVGYTMKWDSENKSAGKGEQEITKITAGEGVYYEVRFIKPFEGTAYSSITTTGLLNNSTNVVWTFRGYRNYGMRIFHILFNIKKMLNKDLTKSLANLKTIVENR